jgi:hypothetical protein
MVAAPPFDLFDPAARPKRRQELVKAIDRSALTH